MSEFTPFQSHNPIDVGQVNSQGGVAPVSYGPGDSQLLVGFYPRSVLNRAQSQQKGKPIYDRVDFVKIQQPGEKLNVVDRPATDFDKARFRNQWASYQEGKDQSPDGIPLTHLFPHRPEIVDTMKGYKIHTVEALANLSGHAIDTVGMGARDWVNAAQSYLKQAEKGVDFHRFNKEMDAMKLKNTTLERQVSELAARLAQITSTEVGRPVPVQTMPDLSKFDHQASMINNTLEPQVSQPPVQFSNEIGPRRGRPKGSKNKAKES